ncbi:MAG: sugar ABC transporter permease, partial [Clostridiales bacterium]|nr:sugar ABC transporter permease [Clostridiales bacterium]
MKGWLFTLPWTLGFCAFFAYPLAQSALYGFSNIRLTAAGRKISPVGWDNYAYIFQRDIYFMERL